ncbi:MAG: hypothetical protein RMA76_44020 [Deltaproteobacteria bacterium]|jgi:phosphatidylserine/phosphatidylglycerophosphate/cardiolipin synthase-like enzyme
MTVTVDLSLRNLLEPLGRRREGDLLHGRPPYLSLHAKCVVVDERSNGGLRELREPGMQRNLECGVRVEDTALTRRLARQWMDLVWSGHVRSVPLGDP